MTIARVAGSGLVMKDRLGNAYQITPLTIRDFGQVEIQALLEFRKQQYQTDRAFAEMHDGEERTALLDAARQKFAATTEKDLPRKFVTVLVKGEKREVPADYPMWWMSETVEGRIYAIWLSLRKVHKEMTIDQCDKIFTDSIAKGDESLLEEFADALGEVSMPSINPSPPPDRPAGETVATGRRGRRRRRQ